MLIKKLKEQARARMELLCDALEQLPGDYQPDDAEKELAARLQPLLAGWLPPPPEPEQAAEVAVDTIEETTVAADVVEAEVS